jgi:hypothetical protein
MTYRDLKNKLSEVPEEELDKEVIVNIYSNDDRYKVHNLVKNTKVDRWEVDLDGYYLAVIDNAYNI